MIVSWRSNPCQNCQTCFRTFHPSWTVFFSLEFLAFFVVIFYDFLTVIFTLLLTSLLGRVMTLLWPCQSWAILADVWHSSIFFRPLSRSEHPFEKSSWLSCTFETRGRNVFSPCAIFVRVFFNQNSIFFLFISWKNLRLDFCSS